MQEFFEQQSIILQHVNLGGGLGINYQNPDSELIANFENYFATFHQHLQRRKSQEVHFELGRAI
ncbi:MAG: diaminopimelate decarboxylase, partial [Bacteroidota bacterium]